MQDKDKIYERWEWLPYFSALLNAISATVDRVFVENTAQRPIALFLGDPLSPVELAEALRAMTNGKALGPGGLPAELWEIGLVEEPAEILYSFHSIIPAVWKSGKVPREWNDAIKLLHKKDRT